MFIAPNLAQWAPASVITNPPPLALLLTLVVAPILLRSVGGIPLGIASVRAGIFARQAGLLLVAQGVLNFLVVPLPPSPIVNLVQLAPDVAYYLALVWFGYALVVTGRESNVVQPLGQSLAHTAG